MMPLNNQAAHSPIGYGSLSGLGVGAFNINRIAGIAAARQIEADQQDRVLAAAQGKPAPKPRISADKFEKALAAAAPYLSPDRLPGGKAAGSNTTGSRAVMAAAVASGIPAFVDPRSGQAADVVKVQTAAPTQIVAQGTAAVGPTAVVKSPTAQTAYDVYARAAEKQGVQVARSTSPAADVVVPIQSATPTAIQAAPIQVQTAAPFQYQAPVQYAPPAQYQPYEGTPYTSPPALAPQSYDAYSQPYSVSEPDPYASQPDYGYAAPVSYAAPVAYDTGSWGSWGGGGGADYGSWGASSDWGVYGLRGLSFGSIFKGIGNALKSVVPAVLPMAAAFIPGAGGLVASAVGSLASGMGGTAPAVTSIQSPLAQQPTASTQPSFFSQIGQALGQAALQAIPVASEALLQRLIGQKQATGSLPPGFITLANGQIAQVVSTQGQNPAPTAPRPSAPPQSANAISPAMLLAGAALLILAMRK